MQALPESTLSPYTAGDGENLAVRDWPLHQQRRATALGPVQKLLLATLPRIAPNLRVGNGLDANFLSHDPAVVAAYRADPLCHDRISARLARFIATEGPATVAQASHWSTPTLLLWAGQDRLVDPAGSAAFARAAPAGVVQAQCFAPLYHELFNETDAEPVFQRLGQWLNALLPATHLQALQAMQQASA